RRVFVDGQPPVSATGSRGNGSSVDGSGLLSIRTVAEIDRLVEQHFDELVAFRRDLHAHPEIGRHEFRTTDKIVDRLSAAGLEAIRLPTGTGLLCDLGDGSADLGKVALRADIDALRMADEKDVEYRSTN